MEAGVAGPPIIADQGRLSIRLFPFPSFSRGRPAVVEHTLLLDQLETRDMPLWARRTTLRVLRDLAHQLSNWDRFRYDRLVSDLEARESGLA